MNALHNQLEALDRRAWQVRFTNRLDLHEAVGEMLRLAPPDSIFEGRAHYHHAVWAWQENKRAESDAARGEAMLLFRQLGDVAGIANCRDLEALAERATGNYVQAVALSKINRELPESSRAPAEHCVSCMGEGAAYLALAQHDACQRVWSIAVALAQRSANPGLEVSALCNLGAWNIAVCNFEDGRELSERAFSLANRVFDLARPASMTIGWFNSGMNLLVALDCLGYHVDACAVAQRMMALEDCLPPLHLANYFVTFASAYLHAGDANLAEIFLRRSLAAGQAAPEFVLERSIVQAEIWNLRGRHADTRALCSTVVRSESSVYGDVSPYDLMRLHNAATIANEALGDYEAALSHQKTAFEEYETLVEKSARARRLTLEIQAELLQTEWQRDQALNLRRAAEVEQARLAELNAALQSANTAKSGFLAAASHDLRQPVHVVSLLADTLAGKLTDPKQSDLVVRIQQSTVALQRLLGELLDISELDAGATRAQIGAFPVSEFLLQLDAEFRGIAISRGLQLRLAAVDAWVVSDASHLLRIMRNVIANALTYTERGGILLAARARRNEILLEVWDTGVGIAPEHLPHLFEAFYQVGNRARDRRKGLGLGLAVTKRIADLLGHPLEFRSRPGKGTRARLTLPRASGVADPLTGSTISRLS